MKTTFYLRKCLFSLFLLCTLLGSTTAKAQHSVAREWNEILLEAIRNDFARPTVHARNLFHISLAMYDAWAAYDTEAEPYLLGKSVNGFYCPYSGISTPADVDSFRNEAISYAAYNIIRNRFASSPGMTETFALADDFMDSLGYDKAYSSVNYASDSAAALGNFIAWQTIKYGDRDSSNQANDYANNFYNPVNDPLIPKSAGNPDIVDPNRWQPLALETNVDQSGNLIPKNVLDFLSPEWGQVYGFALSDDDLTTYNRDAFDYKLYHDPGAPPYIDPVNGGTMSEEYQWGFSLVSVWSSHLDTTDGVMWDISPNAIGNITSYPKTVAEYRNFYDLENGGDPSPGYPYNPSTGQPYEEQWVPRGDYARVLAEFWADGPDSETPPGHWFTILNYVNDHQDFEKRYNGKGDVLDDLEWDVKAYFTLAGGMHDAAISAWGVKGWYDYIRPISAIRYMADRGQSSDNTKPNYHIGGIPLVPGYIELVEAGDPLVGAGNVNLNKIKLYAWQGPDYISDPETDMAEVDWILAEDWWPYQRPSFVTPPFAGYVSGHSTYSRAAAEIMTLLTGDAYFPGGMGEFLAPKNEFLVFEEGPSMDVTLQWATYRDASDQCSLSRIWGGIHPPADDIPGRLMGIEIGVDAFFYAKKYFDGSIVTSTDDLSLDENGHSVLYPNVITAGQSLRLEVAEAIQSADIAIYSLDGTQVFHEALQSVNKDFLSISPQWTTPGMYVLQGVVNGRAVFHKIVVR